MCLCIKEGDIPKIAKKDIICYKHIMKNWGEYFTSYQKKSVKIGNTYHSGLERFNNEIHKGLHSYKYKEDAIKESEKWVEILAKCIIPKGSKYYEGIFDRSVALASDCLKYVEIIKDYSK